MFGTAEACSVYVWAPPPVTERKSTRPEAASRRAITAMSAAPRPPGLNSSPEMRAPTRSEEHTSELQSRLHLVCRLLLEKKKNNLGERPRTVDRQQRNRRDT